MSKIAKLIAKALNNSNTQEAAQSLKMAASYMAKEDVNPSLFIQLRGEHQEQPKKDDNGVEKDILSAELKEAKLLAIHWHKVAKSQAADLEDLKGLANQWQHIAVDKSEKLTTLKKWVKGLGTLSVILGILTAIIANQNFDNLDVITALRADRANYKQQIDYLTEQNIKQLATKPDEKATCFIKGRFHLKANSKDKDTTLKFQFLNGVVTTFRDGLAVESNNMKYDLKQFTNEVNKNFPNITECRIGVLE